MSLILDALKKLDREKASRRKGMPDLAAEILRTDPAQPRKRVPMYLLAVFFTALATAGITYAIIVKPGFLPKSPPPSAGIPPAPGQAGRIRLSGDRHAGKTIGPRPGHSACARSEGCSHSSCARFSGQIIASSAHDSSGLPQEEGSCLRKVWCPVKTISSCPGQPSRAKAAGWGCVSEAQSAGKAIARHTGEPVGIRSRKFPLLRRNPAFQPNHPLPPRRIPLNPGSRSPLLPFLLNPPAAFKAEQNRSYRKSRSKPTAGPLRPPPGIKMRSRRGPPGKQKCLRERSRNRGNQWPAAPLQIRRR